MHCTPSAVAPAVALLANVVLAADPAPAAKPNPDPVRVTMPETKAQPNAAPAPREAARPAARRQEPPSTPTQPLVVVALESRTTDAAAPNGGIAAPGASLFAVQDPPKRSFEMHDLVTIVVSEQSRAKSSAKNKTEKTYDMAAEVTEFWDWDFSAWDTDARLNANQLPGVAIGSKKKLDGKGDWSRNDDFTAKITAEVVEVRPNGNVVLEAYKEIRTDGEMQTIRITGECRPQDIDTTNNVQSHRLANATIAKVTTGELRDATQKGIFSQFLDAVFAF